MLVRGDTCTIYALQSIPGQLTRYGRADHGIAMFYTIHDVYIIYISLD